MRKIVVFAGLLLLLAGTACNLSEQVTASEKPDPVVEVVRGDVTPVVPTATLLASPTPQFTPTPSATPFEEPSGCLRPPDDYTRVQIGNATLNARTLWMLERAQQLYGGTIPFSGAGLTQGSYNPGVVSASFGTHDGGGAVDLTVRNLPYSWDIKWDDIPLMIDALRLAGFAAFYRDEREDLTPHIHAIAIGDAELSPAAQLQLTGRYGYFRGYDGFPRDDGIPLTPRHGDLVICQWMVDMGYRDMRGEPLPLE